MTSPDSDFRYHPQEEYAQQRPGWVPLHRTAFEAESIGYKLFPDFLEGRVRPFDIFRKPIENVWKNNETDRGIREELQRFGASHLSDVFDLPYHIAQPHNRQRIEKCVSQIFADFALVPHAKLLEKLYGVRLGPIPAEDEPKLIAAVKKMLEYEDIPEREREVLRYRFGLKDGISRTYREIGNALGISRTRVLQIKKHAMSKLRHPKRRGPVKSFLPAGALDEF